MGIPAAIVHNLAAEAAGRSLVEAVVRSPVEAVVRSPVEDDHTAVVDYSLAVAAVEDRWTAAHILAAVVAHTVAAGRILAVAAEEGM